MKRPKISVFIAVSLDGFIARPDGDVAWLTAPEYAIDNEDFGYKAFINSVDALVMGRNSYEKVLTFDQWYYDGTPVIVLSSQPVDIPENLTGKVENLCSCSPADVVRQLGERGIRHVYLDGGQTIQAFLCEGLVDELTLTRLPILLGAGIPLFSHTLGDIRLRHRQTHTFSNGFVQSIYTTVLT